MDTPFYQRLTEDLRGLREQGLYKTERQLASPQGAEIRTQDGKPVLNLCANNYLGLAAHPSVREAAHRAIDRYGYGMASVRFICGTHQVHRELEEAAQMSGARWLATQLRILIPLLTPALGSAFLVAFIIALREFTIPFILYSSENLVLPVLVWQLFQNGEPARSAALGVLMIAVVLPGILALRLFLVRRN